MCHLFLILVALLLAVCSHPSASASSSFASRVGDLSFSVGSSDHDCPAVPSVPGDRRTDKSVLRVVQYNAEWLFTDYFANSNCPGTGCPWENSTAANTHLQYVTNVIATLNPDIINFCEVEGCDELSQVKAAFTNQADYYNMYLKNGTDSSTGQNVGVLTKIDPIVSLYRNDNRVSYPVPGSQCGYHGTSSTYGVSKHYITEYQIGSMKLAMVGLHLLAFPDDVTRCAEREAQATVLQQSISSYVSKGYEVIVLAMQTILTRKHSTPIMISPYRMSSISLKERSAH